MSASATLATLAAAADDQPCAVREPASFQGIRAPESEGRFLHRREPIFLDARAAPGAERAALYSIAVFDLEAGPVTVTLPDAGRRHMTLTAMDERHALQAVYHGPGAHVLRRDRVGARRVMAVFCLMLDTAHPEELALARAVQDAIEVRQHERRPRSHWSTFQAPTAL
jgi:hypothetical protein